MGAHDIGPGPWWKQLAWLVAIWTMSVGALALLAAVLRAWLHG